MVLYLAIVLLALLAGFGWEEGAAHQVRLIWGTSIGLGLAHLFAFRMTAVMAAGGRPTGEDYRSILGMAGAVLATSAIATVPYFVLSDPVNANTGASLVLLMLIGLAGYGSARRADATVPRSLLYTGIVLSVAVVVVAIKIFFTH